MQHFSCVSFCPPHNFPAGSRTSPNKRQPHVFYDGTFLCFRLNVRVCVCVCVYAPFHFCREIARTNYKITSLSTTWNWPTKHIEWMREAIESHSNGCFRDAGKFASNQMEHHWFFARSVILYLNVLVIKIECMQSQTGISRYSNQEHKCIIEISTNEEAQTALDSKPNEKWTNPCIIQSRKEIHWDQTKCR